MIKARFGAVALIGLALGVMPSAGSAHSVGRSSLSLVFEDASGRADFRVGVRDLDALLGLDTDRDLEISADELARASRPIASYVLDRVEFSADGAPCRTEVGSSSLEGSYLRLSFGVLCPTAARNLSLRYDLFFDHDFGHTAQVVFAQRGQSSTAVLTASSRYHEFQLGAADASSRALEYFKQGIWHIWTGYDHLLFLLTLLLPAGLVRFRIALIDVAKIVSAFTLAHSLTLSLAAIGVVHLPSRWVETAIAVTVCWAALNNLYGWVTQRLWIVALGFGLIHGFGFASVLEELGLPQQLLLVALVAFNVGVEVGQLAVVLVCLPLLAALGTSTAYARWGVRLGSLAIVGLGVSWMLERAFDLPIALAVETPPPVAQLWPLGVGLAGALVLLWFGRRSRWATAGAWLASLASVSYGFSQAHAHRANLGGALRTELERSGAAVRALDLPAARDALARATALSRELGDDRAEAEVQTRTAALHVARGDLARARTAHERALATYQALGDDRAAANTQRDLGVLAQLAGDSALAARALRRALALHERLGDRAAAARDAADLAVIYRRSKQYADSEAAHRRASQSTVITE